MLLSAQCRPVNPLSLLSPAASSWHSLESKPGRKRKERGRVQVSVQFMRNNMTASMFDLSMKEKPRSPFSKLKHKMKGRKHDGGDASSAIVPRSAGDPDAAPPPEAKGGRSLLAGGHKLSAAHSMSDLVGAAPQAKPDTMNSIDERGEDLGAARVGLRGRGPRGDTVTVLLLF